MSKASTTRELPVDAAGEGERRSFVLTDVCSRLYSDEIVVGPADLGVDPQAGWQVSKTTLRGGKQEGVGLITLDNGRLRVEVIETRGLSLLSIQDGDFRLGWQSPVNEVVHPNRIDLSSKGGCGWLEGFNEMLVRCGLEYAGAPGCDEFTDSHGVKRHADLTLHGRIGNTPASRVEVFADTNPPYSFGVRGLVQERCFSGPAIDLIAEVSMLPGDRHVRIVDEVTNHGAASQEFMLIYHTNFGPPLLGDGARLVLPTRTATQRGGGSLSPSPADYGLCGPPARGYEEEVHFVEPLTNPDGQAIALLQNSVGDRGASLRWNVAELPHFTFWKNLASLPEGYVVGLEPGVCYPNHRGVERTAGRLPALGAGQSRSFTLELGLHGNGQEVKELYHEALSL